METWMRYRFHANGDDYRPVKFPPPGPFWCTGYGDGYAVIVAYLPLLTPLKDYWPEASEISATEHTEIIYTDRFPKPLWYEPAPETAP